MFGFLFGAVSLAGLIASVRHRRHWRHGHWGGHGGHWGSSWIFRRVSEHLDATPGQEKVIESAVEDVFKAVRGMRDSLLTGRRDIATAFKSEAFDQEPLKQAFIKQDRAAEELQRSILVSLGKVHEALEPRQREALADLVENGFGRSHSCGGRARWQRRGWHGGPFADAHSI